MTTIYIATDGIAYLPFATNQASDGAATDASATNVYTRSVGASADQALNTTGVTVSLLSDGGAPPGLYEVAIDASAAGFSSGATYNVYADATVGGVQSVAALGQIVVSELLTGKDLGLLFESGITTVNSQTSFDCSGTINSNDNWLDNEVIITDETNGDSCTRRITDVVAASDRIIIDAAPTFTVTTDDTVRVRGTVHPYAAIASYDPPTRAELTTDTNTVLDKLLAYFQLALRSDAAIPADRSTELSAINNDEGSGAGDYDNETDSLEHGNTKRMNNTVVQGDGTSGDLWRG